MESESKLFYDLFRFTIIFVRFTHIECSCKIANSHYYVIMAHFIFPYWNNRCKFRYFSVWFVFNNIMTILIHIFGRTYVCIPMGICMGKELLDDRVCMCWALAHVGKRFSKEVYQLHNYHQQCINSPIALHPCLTLCILLLSCFVCSSIILLSMCVVSHCSFNLHFP